MGSSGAGVPQFINPTTNPLRVGSTIGVQVPLSRTFAQTLLPMSTTSLSHRTYAVSCAVVCVSCVSCVCRAVRYCAASALDRRRLTAPPGVIQRELLAQQEAAAMTAAPEESTPASLSLSLVVYRVVLCACFIVIPTSCNCVVYQRLGGVAAMQANNCPLIRRSGA
jgi:hypothetical protein